MTTPTPSRSPVAGGFIVAIAVLAGSFIGAFKGQPTIGFLIGFGIGAVIAGAIWLIGRSR